jgi:colicin import membrane protein
MFNELRRVFRESLAAFQAEVGRREPEDEVAELLAAMRRELVAARAALPAYRQEIARAEAAARTERELQHQCERRRDAAERIGDQETARIAAEFFSKHRDRAEVLERKVAASRAELELRTREAGEMMNRFREAEANRFALLAELRTARTRGLIDTLLDGEAPAPGPSPSEIDERLRELKRTMGQE